MRGHYEGAGMDRRMLHALKVGSLASNVSPVVKGLQVLGICWCGEWWGHKEFSQFFFNLFLKKSVFCCVKIDPKEFVNVNQCNQGEVKKSLKNFKSFNLLNATFSALKST